MNRDAGGTSGARAWRRRWLAAVLALSLIVGGVAVAPSWLGRRPDAADLHLRAARQALTRGRLDEAAAELGKAQEKGSPSPEVDRLWGLLYSRAGRSDDALLLLRRAWDQPGRGADPEVAEALARVTMNRFELTEAITVLDRWAREDPADPKPLVWRAEIDRRTGADRSVTIGHFQEALRRDVSCDEARLGLAEMLYLEGQHAESAEAYAVYAARNPDVPAGHVGLGSAARAQGDVAAAVAALDRGLALDPDNTLALKERSHIDLRQGHPLDALRRLDRAVAADPFDPALRYQRSLALAGLGRRDEADADRRHSEQLRREHIEMDEMTAQLVERPADNALRCRAARWMLDHGRADEAAQWARLVLRDHPDHPQANHVLADFHQRRGELGLANFYRLHAVPVPARESAQPGPD